MNLDRLVSLLKRFEGFRPYVYDDKSPWPRTEVGRHDCELRGGQYKVRATGGTATVGYGETDAKVIDRCWGRRIDEAEATAILYPRAQGFADGVAKCISRALTAHQHEACACRAYQSGVGGFCRSETARLLNAGDINAALIAWRRDFAHPDRSDAEISHFRTPDSPAPTRRRARYLYWYKDGLFYSDGIHRTPFGLAPPVVDALVKQGVPILGQAGDTWTEGTHNSLKSLV